MSENDLSIRIVAEVDPLQKALAEASATVEKFKVNLASGLKIDSAGMAAPLRELDAALAAAAVTSRRSAAEIGAALNGLSRHEWLNLSRQFQDVGVSLASGMNPLTVAIQQGSQIFDVFQAHVGGASAALKSFGATLLNIATNPLTLAAGGVAAAGGALVYLAREAGAASAVAREFSAELAQAGNISAGFRGELIQAAGAFARLREGHLWDWAKEGASSVFPSLAGALSLSGEQARGLLSALAFVPNVSNEAISSFAELARSVRGVFGEEAVDRLTAYAKQLADPQKALENISKSFSDLSTTQRAEIKATLEAGDAAKQTALAWSILSREFVRSQGEQILAKAATEAHSAAERDRIRALAEGARASGDWAGALLQASHVSDAVTSATRKMQASLEELRQEFAKPVSAGALMAAAERLSAGTPSSQIAKLTGDINTLDEAARRGASSAAELVKQFEGFTPEAKWDVNHFRMGFGSDTATDANGRVGTVLEGMRTTEEDAMRDLNRRIVTYQNDLMNELGDSWGRLPAKVQNALTSVAYNYGKLPRDIAATAKTGDTDAIAAAISKHGDDNDGVNAKRRTIEAAIVASANQEHEARAKISDDLQKQRDIQAGGSAIDKAALETARATANAGRDEVAAHERSVAALEKQLNLTSQVLDRTKLETQLGSERESLRQARARQTAADASLKASGEFPGTAEWEKYKLAGVDAMQAVTKKGTAEWSAFEEQKTAITRQAEAFRDSLAESALNRELQFKLGELKAEESRIKAAGERRNLTATEEIAALQLIADQRYALQKAHYDKIAALYDDDKKKLAEIETEKTRIVGQRLAERANIEKQFAARQEAETRAFADRVASTAGGIFNAWQTGKSPLQAIQSSMRSMLQSAVENNVRVLAQMLGNTTVFGRAFGQVMDGSLLKSQVVGKGIADNLQKPTEGLAGGLQSSMGKAFDGMKNMFSSVLEGLGSMLKSFLESASSLIGSLFKGIGSIGGGFGGLGSILPSFDVGAWNVESGGNADGKGGFPALVHPGEMIVPAGPAAALRAALAGVGMTLGGLPDMALAMPASMSSAPVAATVAGAASQSVGLGLPPVTVHNYAPGLVIKPEVTKDYVHIVVREAIAGNNKRQAEADRRGPN